MYSVAHFYDGSMSSIILVLKEQTDVAFIHLKYSRKRVRAI